MGTSPLIERPGSDLFATVDHQPVTVSAFAQATARAAAALPPGTHVLIDCSERYSFLLAFFAATAAGRTTLLPTNRTPRGLEQAARTVPGTVTTIDDAAVAALTDEPLERATPDMPSIDDASICTVAFTSGSTGQPQPHAKRWGDLRRATRLHAGQLTLEGGSAALVSTVPPWHMYGLEWSVLIATFCPVTLCCGPNLFPSDVQTALENAVDGRVLITTPVHLRALVRSGAVFPRVDTIVCATAPLEPELAEAAERTFGGRLLEIYGCTEAGTIAYRNPTCDQSWRPFPGYEVRADAHGASVRTAFAEGAVRLADRIQLHSDGTFALGGRVGDLLKIAGKRTSLADLTAALMTIEGVQDGVVFEPSDDDHRPCAFVVAPGSTAEAIRRRLAKIIDPVFLPRPLRLVDALPRSATGKLSKDALIDLLERESQ